jgi:hypothetical protein
LSSSIPRLPLSLLSRCHVLRKWLQKMLPLPPLLPQLLLLLVPKVLLLLVPPLPLVLLLLPQTRRKKLRRRTRSNSEFVQSYEESWSLSIRIFLFSPFHEEC